MAWRRNSSSTVLEQREDAPPALVLGRHRRTGLPCMTQIGLFKLGGGFCCPSARFKLPDLAWFTRQGPPSA
jgi:hypothetical protein